MDLFDQYSLARNHRDQTETLKSLCREIRLHVSVEFGVFYPVVARELLMHAILTDAGVEFACVTQLVNEIADTDAGS